MTARPLHVDGVRIAGRTGATEMVVIDVVEPATGTLIASVSGGGPADAQRALDAACDTAHEWAASSTAERASALRAIANDLEATADIRHEVIRTLTRESGKRLSESAGEIMFSAGFFRWFADLILTTATEAWEVVPGIAHHVRPVPLGVVAVLTPWNFPASIPARKLAPAIAAGCTVVFRPSQLAPLTAIALAEIVERHLPAGVVNIVTGDAAAITDVWLDDERLRGLTFTGSTSVGRSLGRRAGERLKMATLELGGRAPFIVLDDADVESAVADLLVAKYRNNGQSCIAANNVWVARELWHDFTDAFLNRTSGMTVGDPAVDDVDLGPMRTVAAVERLARKVSETSDAGASILSGSTPQGPGSYHPPTVVIEPPQNSSLWREEIFGPVAPMRPYDDIEEVFRDVAYSEYGLAGYVSTSNPDRGAAVASEMECGLVGINVASPNTPQIPFGGMKASGFGGYEGGRLGLDPFVKYQTIAVKAGNLR